MAIGQVRQTHTYVELELSKAAYDEIATKLRAAGYDHVFMENEVIDMRGLAVTWGAPPTGEVERLRAILRRCVPGTESVDIGGETICLCLSPSRE